VAVDRDTISVSTINEEVYDRLRVAIRTGDLAPGVKVSLRSLAATLGVSTMPVREAMRKLQAQGLVEFERRSVTVVQLAPDEVVQVFQIRLRLEHLAAEWALPRLTDDDVADLRAVLAEMADPGLDPAVWRRLNRRFHERFYECAGSPHLLELIHNIGDRVESSMAVYASTVDDFAEAHRQHLRMLELIECRNLPGLLDETAWHLEHTSRTVAEALAEALGAERPARSCPATPPRPAPPDEGSSPQDTTTTPQPHKPARRGCPSEVPPPGRCGAPAEREET
jgi:DNA-binding GntR family transcriptional regulator